MQYLQHTVTCAAPFVALRRRPPARSVALKLVRPLLLVSVGERVGVASELASRATLLAWQDVAQEREKDASECMG